MKIKNIGFLWNLGEKNTCKTTLRTQWYSGKNTGFGVRDLHSNSDPATFNLSEFQFPNDTMEIITLRVTDFKHDTVYTESAGGSWYNR